MTVGVPQRCQAWMVWATFAFTFLIFQSSSMAGAEARYTVYYFHTTARCSTCVKIEGLAKQVVESEFRSEIETGRLQFRSIDVQEPGNRHFVKDFQLVTKSIVLVREQAGRPPEWKNLNRVWELIWSDSRYRSYIQSEVAVFLGEE